MSQLQLLSLTVWFTTKREKLHRIFLHNLSVHIKYFCMGGRLFGTFFVCKNCCRSLSTYNYARIDRCALLLKRKLYYEGVSGLKNDRESSRRVSFTGLNSFVLSLSREKGHCSLKAVFGFKGTKSVGTLSAPTDRCSILLK